PGPVVPGAVEQHDLPRRRQMRRISLEEPLADLAVRWLWQGHHAGVPWGHVFGHPLDRSVLAGGVASLEDDEDLPVLLDRPRLAFDHGGLQLLKFGFV